MNELSSMADVLEHVSALAPKKRNDRYSRTIINYKGIDFDVVFDYHPGRRPVDRDDQGCPEMAEIVDILHCGDSFMKVFENDLCEFEERILTEENAL